MHRTVPPLVIALCACLFLLPEPTSAVMLRELPLTIRVQVSAARRRALALRRSRQRLLANSVLASRVRLIQSQEQRTATSDATHIPPTPAPASPPSTRVQSKPEREPLPEVHATPMQEEILRLVNRERGKRGLTALRLHALLQESARDYAEDMHRRDFFGHLDPDGRSSLDRIRRVGYVRAPCDCSWTYMTGENLAHGQESPAQVVQDWMASDGHRENILQPGFQHMGIGIHAGYWVQHFGSVHISVDG